LQWAIDERVVDAFRIAPNLARWWVRRASLSEASQWFSRLLDAVPNDRAPRDRARVLGALGNMALIQADYDEAERLLRESDALFSALGDVRGSAHMRSHLAAVLVERGQYAAAETLLTECVKVARSLGDHSGAAENLGNLAIAVYERGDIDRAAPLLEETLAVARGLGDSFFTSRTLSAVGLLEVRRGNLESADASFREILTIARELKDPYTTTMGLERFADLAVATRAPRRATILWGVIARLRGETGVLLAHREKTALADARLTMELEEAIRCALSGGVERRT
jgi:non-specific serine/threonine protein kinase